MFFSGGCAFVVRARGRIRPDSHKGFACREGLVTSPRRNENRIASFQNERAASLPAKPDARVTARNAQHLVNARMIMEIVIDITPPAIAPSVLCEKIFEHRGRIEGTRQRHDPSIDQHWPEGVVGCFAVVTKPQGEGLADAKQLGSGVRWRPLPPCGALGQLLEVLNECHTGSDLSSTADRDGFTESHERFDTFNERTDLTGTPPRVLIRGHKPVVQGLGLEPLYK
jgi:hypothetical protein